MPLLGCQLFRAKELLGGILQAAESRNRRAWSAHTADMRNTLPSESEALDAMQRMGDVLAQCNCGDGAKAMAALLAKAQGLVEAARASAMNTAATSVALDRRQWENLVRYRAFHDFERRLRATAGAFHFQNGTIAFGHRADPWENDRKDRIKDPAVKSRLQHIAAARHSLFHRVTRNVPVAAVVADMGVVLRRL